MRIRVNFESFIHIRVKISRKTSSKNFNHKEEDEGAYGISLADATWGREWGGRRVVD